MQVKITNSVLNAPYNINAEQSLSFIYPALLEFKKIKVPVPVAYNIIKSIGVVEKAIKDFQETRISICETLCEKDGDNKSITNSDKYKFTEENKKEFDSKFKELLNSEIIIDIFPINNSDIISVKDINISCYETLLKHGFIKE